MQTYQRITHTLITNLTRRDRESRLTIQTAPLLTDAVDFRRHPGNGRSQYVKHIPGAVEPVQCASLPMMCSLSRFEAPRLVTSYA